MSFERDCLLHQNQHLPDHFSYDIILPKFNSNLKLTCLGFKKYLHSLKYVSIRKDNDILEVNLFV